MRQFHSTQPWKVFSTGLLVAALACAAVPARQRGSALLDALRKDEAEKALFWLERGADANFAEMRRGEVFARPVFYSIARGNQEITERLIAAGANLEDTGYQGMTPLMEAARTGQTRIARLLLLRGAKIDATDNLGRTAISWAAIAGHEDCIALLIEKGAHDKKADDGRNAAGYAALLNRRRIFEMLQKQNKKDKQLER